MKIRTLFSGIGGTDCGARSAGIDLADGFEIDAEAAAIANRNLGDHVKVADILGVDPSTLPYTDILHASPPCPSFSLAKKGARETDLDIALAQKVADFIIVQRPKIFTLENVWGYRKSKSWGKVWAALTNAGYWATVDHVNAADYGVPQTRKRMIVRAVRDGWVPMLPQPERWVGWYETIEDLIPSLPETEFAPWQIERLPVEIKSYLFGNQVMGEVSGISRKPANLPAQTVTTQNAQSMRAYLIGGGNTNLSEASPGRGAFVESRPSPCVTAGASAQQWRSFVVDGMGNGGNSSVTSGRDVTVCRSDKPFYSVSASQKSAHRAWIHHGRVVKITLPCLLRFQAFPDTYKGATVQGVGNAVPPLLYEKIIRQLVEANQ